MAGVADNMVPVVCEPFKGVLVIKLSFEFLEELKVQLCALGILIMACSGKDVEHLGNMQDRCPLWSTNHLFLIKTLITSNL